MLDFGSFACIVLFVFQVNANGLIAARLWGMAEVNDKEIDEGYEGPWELQVPFGVVVMRSGGVWVADSADGEKHRLCLLR